jgi:antitoxin VapB
MPTAKLFFDGDDQCVELPDEFRFRGSEVRIRRNSETGEVVLSAMPQDEDNGRPEGDSTPTQ